MKTVVFEFGELQSFAVKFVTLKKRLFRTFSTCLSGLNRIQVNVASKLLKILTSSSFLPRKKAKNFKIKDKNMCV